ncbi:hypothetical protein [Saccharopolyspora rosea]|uniref:Uncharacterized protein n=1 Tax=Saccharopolyspora rosea TaxID=524884 RepID=A0ABW3FRG5_9PSEU|nr:hypothetical protein [Saccharopolyspora rosea]
MSADARNPPRPDRGAIPVNDTDPAATAAAPGDAAMVSLIGMRVSGGAGRGRFWPRLVSARTGWRT